MSNDNGVGFITITEADLKRFAPKAKREYVVALLGGLYHLRAAGILDNPYRVAHFMAQFGHETGGLTIIRENLHFTSAKRLREVWPSRFRDKSDADLAPLLRNGVVLGDVVYGGRMGNAPTGGDGYSYRGGGPFQSTGKGAVAKYAKRLGLEPSPQVLDDCGITLQFACLEWAESKCGACADENDLTKVSKAINTGSATSNVKPVDMESRQEWFAKAWSIWGEKGTPDGIVNPLVAAKNHAVKLGIAGLGVLEGGRQIASYVPPVPPQLTEAVTNLDAWKGLLMQLGGMGSEAVVAGGAGVGAAIAAAAAAKKWWPQ